MDLRLLHHNVVLTVTDVGNVTFAEIPRLDPEQKWDLKTTEMNSCSKPGILNMFVIAVVVKQNVCCLLPVGQSNAAWGVVHEMVLAERWPPKYKNLCIRFTFT